MEGDGPTELSCHIEGSQRFTRWLANYAPPGPTDARRSKAADRRVRPTCLGNLFGGQGPHGFFEDTAAVFVALELVETGAGGGEEDDVAWLGGGRG
jgi:hypothetical protein